MGFVRVFGMEKPERMTHVALLLPELEAGGAQRVMLILAREFRERGHRVDLVLIRATGALIASVPDGVNLVNLAAKSNCLGLLGLGLSAIGRLVKWVNTERPDVLLSTITGANLVALIAREIAGVRFRVVVREAVSLKNVSGTFRFRLMKWAYPRADAVIALSTFMKEELIKYIGVEASRVHYVSNPIDVPFIREQSKVALEHPWLDDREIRVIISVGRLTPQKGFDTLMRAFALLPEALNARLIIVGEGIERARLERLAKELGIIIRMQLVGFDANPWRWMRRADLFVLSSNWEGQPNALREALVLGVPVVATDYDLSVRDLVSNAGVEIVPVGDSSALALAIENELGSESGQTHQAIDAEEAVGRYLHVLVGNGSSPGWHRSQA